MAPLISHLNACVLMHFQIKLNGWFCMGIFWPVGSGDLLPFLLREIHALNRNMETGGPSQWFYPILYLELP